MPNPKLYMLLLGCTPPGRHTEQHDVFFAIGEDLKSLIPDILAFWPEANGRIHIDAYREVTLVDGHQVSVEEKGGSNDSSGQHLFFINLGGYKRGLFDEPHFKIISVHPDMGSAIKTAKNTEFFLNTHFPGAFSHVDDKFGIDVDDVYEVADILPLAQKEKYRIMVEKATSDAPEDELNLGYFKLANL
ncbi:MAG TPA: DUF1543 domain-containing protein [Mucilaginibacter sp.]|nr:DUF1543 domain-containing protein [Mucilaginibacter sp.]HVW13181.1 DUF1543 domain-containing protein [Mucilaginibacter sp.]